MPRERNDYHKVILSFPYGKPKLYVIAAEGDKTEYKYFDTLQKIYQEKFRKGNLHVEYLERPQTEAGESNPDYVERMVDIFLENNKDYDFQEDYDELWFIVDTDEYSNRQEVILHLAEKCRENSLFSLGLSNPCFDLWLILHFADLDELVNQYLPSPEDHTIQQYLETIAIKQRARTCKQLLPYLHHNQQPLYEIYIGRIPQAIPRAKHLGDCDPCSGDFPDALCTSVYRLLENIINDIELESS